MNNKLPSLTYQNVSNSIIKEDDERKERIFNLIPLLYQNMSFKYVDGSEEFSIQEGEHSFIIDIDKSGPFTIINQLENSSIVSLSLCITIIYSHIIGFYQQTRIQISNNSINYYGSVRNINNILNLLESILLKKKLEKC